MKKALLGEFLGTFVIVFVPIVAAGADGQGILVGAFASGIPVMGMIHLLGPVSGAHFNPAVTLTLAALGLFEKGKALPYLAAQFLGGIAAGALSFWIHGKGSGFHMPARPDHPLQNLAVEVMLGFILMSVILATAFRKKGALAEAPWAIGLTVVGGVLCGGMITGASMNPARSLGPALFHGPAMPHMWLYLIGPTLGALAAAGLFRVLEGGAQDKP